MEIFSSYLAAVAEGQTIEGTLTIFWQNIGDPELFIEEDVEVGEGGGECGADGKPCDDGDACTVDDTCLGDVCVGGDPVDCSGAGDECNDASCDSDNERPADVRTDEVAHDCIIVPLDPNPRAESRDDIASTQTRSSDGVERHILRTERGRMGNSDTRVRVS